MCNKRVLLILCFGIAFVSSCTKVITEPPVVNPPEAKEDTTNLKNCNDITIVN